MGLISPAWVSGSVRADDSVPLQYAVLTTNVALDEYSHCSTQIRGQDLVAALRHDYHGPAVFLVGRMIKMPRSVLQMQGYEVSLSI